MAIFNQVFAQIYQILSFIIYAIFYAEQGGKITFSISCILKQNWFDDFVRVSIVFEIPIKIKFKFFLWNNFIKSSVTGLAAALKRSSISSMQTTHVFLYQFFQRVEMMWSAVLAVPSTQPNNFQEITSCTSVKDLTIFALSLIIQQSILERIELAHKLLPAPGEPVIIKNLNPFFYCFRQASTNFLIRSISLSLNLNLAGMELPLSISSASVLRRSKLRQDISGFSQTSQALDSQILVSSTLFLVLVGFRGIIIMQIQIYTIQEGKKKLKLHISINNQDINQHFSIKL